MPPVVETKFVSDCSKKYDLSDIAVRGVFQVDDGNAEHQVKMLYYKFKKLRGPGVVLSEKDKEEEAKSRESKREVTVLAKDKMAELRSQPAPEPAAPSPPRKAPPFEKSNLTQADIAAKLD